MSARVTTAWGAAAIFALSVLGNVSMAQQATVAQQVDIAAGRDLARRSCSSCHQVEPGTPQRTDGAPSFAALANDRTKTEAALRAWLFEPHPPMPALSLSVVEIRGLMAYIASLKI